MGWRGPRKSGRVLVTGKLGRRVGPPAPGGPVVEAQGRLVVTSVGSDWQHLDGAGQGTEGSTGRGVMVDEVVQAAGESAT